MPQKARCSRCGTTVDLDCTTAVSGLALPEIAKSSTSRSQIRATLTRLRMKLGHSRVVKYSHAVVSDAKHQIGAGNHLDVELLKPSGNSTQLNKCLILTVF